MIYFQVKGPAGPCKYAFLSNLSATAADDTCLQTSCLATGQPVPLRGAVSITDTGVTGWISGQSDVIIKVDAKPRFLFRVSISKYDLE